MFWNRNAAVLFVATASCLLHLNFAGKGRPVILVPGIAENEIQAQVRNQAAVNHECAELAGKEFTTVYPNSALVTTSESKACLEQLLSLNYDGNKISSTPQHVYTRVPGFGDPVYVEWRNQQDHTDNSSYFNDLVQELVNNGYGRGVTIFGAPYDFRKSPRELLDYFTEVGALIETAHVANCKKRVVLVGHQYGAILINVFLNHKTPQWKDKHIHAFVSLSAPWGGMLSTVESITSGPSLRSMFRTWPSVYTLLPTSIAWSEEDHLISTPEQNYTAGNIEQLLKVLSLDDGIKTWKRVQSVLYKLDAPGVHFFCVHGQDSPTTISATFTRGKFPDGSPSSTSSGNGDGSVRLESLQACDMWKTRQHLMGREFVRMALPGVEHRSIVQDSNVIKYIVKIATDNSEHCETTLALIQ